jgi:hypothetical protein
MYGNFVKTAEMNLDAAGGGRVVAYFPATPVGRAYQLTMRHYGSDAADNLVDPSAFSLTNADAADTGATYAIYAGDIDRKDGGGLVANIDSLKSLLKGGPKLKPQQTSVSSEATGLELVAVTEPSRAAVVDYHDACNWIDRLRNAGMSQAFTALRMVG